jgi:hypothetical protein
MRKFTWLLALSIPVTIISCQKDAVRETPGEEAALTQGTMQTGNGGPSGAHYNLNIIGVKYDKKVDYNALAEEYTRSNGKVIFVDQTGKTRINLKMGAFDVLDANGTDGYAAFQLPDPDPNSDGVTNYSVFARVPGNQKGSADVTTCADGIVLDTDGDGLLEPGEEYAVTLDCEGITFDAQNFDKFQNVSAELLYVTLSEDAWVDLNGNGLQDANEVVKAGRYPIFDERLYGFFWEYDNKGLKLLQLRFYNISSTVDITPDENGNYDPTQLTR